MTDTMKRTDVGIPVNYDSDCYTYTAQLKELRILNLHESNSSDDLEEDAPHVGRTKHHNITDETLPSNEDKGFDSDNSNSFTPTLFDLSDSEQTHRSLTESIFNHKYRDYSAKYDEMEPLMFGVQPPRSNTIKTERIRRDSNPIRMISPPPPPHINGHRSASSSPTEVISSKLTNIELIQTRSRRSSLDIECNKHVIHEEKHPKIDTSKPDNHTKMDDKIRYLMDDIWWFLESDDALRKYKNDSNPFKHNLLLLFNSFNAMNNDGNDVYFMIIKLLNTQMMDFAKSEALRCVSISDFIGGIKAYSVLIRFCFVLKHDSLCLYYLKRSECYFKMNSYEMALFDAKESYKVNHEFERGYLMHCKILMRLHEYEKAKKIYICGYALNAKLKKAFSNGIQNATKLIKMNKESKQIDVIQLELTETLETVETLYKYKAMTLQITNDIERERVKWNGIMCDRTYINMYYDGLKRCNCDCLCVKRVQFWMEVYIEWKERYLSYLSLNVLMDKICRNKYNCALLYHDYAHILEKHNDIHSDCDEKQFCNVFKRHNLPKRVLCIKERKKRYCGYMESKYVSMIQLFDEIHCYLCHFEAFCFDEYIYDLRLNMDDCDDSDSDKDEDQYEDDYTLDEIHSVLSGDNTNRNKFICDIINDDRSMFVYWPYFKSSSMYCAMKYSTLKHELLHNKLCAIDEYIYNDLLIKSQWIEKSLSYNDSMKAKDKGRENDKFGVCVHCTISLRHIMVLLLYSNYIELRNVFIQNGFMHNDMNKNSEIAHFCMFLYESILFYGSEMNENEYFYGGLSSEYHLNQYQLSFKYPISMTSSLNEMVKLMILNANANQTKDIMIIKYGVSDSYGCCYFNLKTFSDNPQQKEVILYNCKLMIHDVFHFDENYGDETKQILTSNYKYIQSLILFEKMVNGRFFISQYDEKQRQLYEKIVAKMIKNFIHPSPIAMTSCVNNTTNIFTKIVENVVHKIGLNRDCVDDDIDIEIPNYIQNLFRFYCENIHEIWLIKSEMASVSDELRVYFIDDIVVNVLNKDCYGSFLRMIETNHRESCVRFINFMNEYLWYFGGNVFDAFVNLKCNESMIGCKIRCAISCVKFDDETSTNPNDFSIHSIVFEANCYRSLKNAASFGAFGLIIAHLPKYIDKIRFEYQVFCKEANYILLVPATNKWYKKGDKICFKSFESNIVTNNNTTKQFSYRFTIKIIEIHKSQK